MLYDVKEEKNVPAIILCMGKKLHNLLNDLAFPKSSASLAYKPIADFLIKHLSSSANTFCERIKFCKCLQFKDEPIQDFSAREKKITIFCRDILNKNLLEQFLGGLKNENI